MLGLNSVLCMPCCLSFCLLALRLPACLQEPAVAEVAQVFERCKDMGLLLGKGGERARRILQPC